MAITGIASSARPSPETKRAVPPRSSLLSGRAELGAVMYVPRSPAPRSKLWPPRPAGQGQVRAAALPYRLTPWPRLFFLLIASVRPSRRSRVIDADSTSRSGCDVGRLRLCGFSNADPPPPRKVGRPPISIYSLRSVPRTLTLTASPPLENAA